LLEFGTSGSEAGAASGAITVAIGSNAGAVAVDAAEPFESVIAMVTPEWHKLSIWHGTIRFFPLLPTETCAESRRALADRAGMKINARFPERGGASAGPIREFKCCRSDYAEAIELQAIVRRHPDFLCGIAAIGRQAAFAMIQLTRLNNQLLVVNSDLIKFVEKSPDTVLTLVTGEKIIVSETVDAVLEKIAEFRRSVTRAANPAVISALEAIKPDPHKEKGTG
jgi:flagellar protein FlbD